MSDDRQNPNNEQSKNEEEQSPAAKESKEQPAETDKEQKAKTAEKPREERANTREKARENSKAPGKKAEPAEEELPPSPNQPLLDKLVRIIRAEVSDEAVEEAYINRLDRDLPCVVIRPEHWVETSLLLKNHEQLQLNYLRNVAGVDRETHLEVVYHLLSMVTREEYCIKVKTDREQSSIPSVTPVWNTANWNEREIYDLLGIDFPGHPDLRRIMMPDDWVGHPLRKDYEPLDPEV